MDLSLFQKKKTKQKITKTQQNPPTLLQYSNFQKTNKKNKFLIPFSNLLKTHLKQTIKATTTIIIIELNPSKIKTNFLNLQ